MKLARFTTVVLTLALAGLVLTLTTRDAVGQEQSPAPEVRTVPPPPTGNTFIPSLRDGFSVEFTQPSAFFTLRNQENSLEREAQSLVEQYSRTEDASKRAKLKSKLAEVLNKQFDAQQKRRTKEVEHIEAQLKKVRELMQKRSEAKDTIVEKRLDQLLREAEGLGWTPPAGPRMPTGYYAPGADLYGRSVLQKK